MFSFIFSFICSCSLAHSFSSCSGAKAFAVISNYTFAYPDKPLKERLIKLLESVKLPITFLYGKESDFYKGGHSSACEIERKAQPVVVVHCIEEAAHHVQVQKPSEMVDYILKFIYPKITVNENKHTQP